MIARNLGRQTGQVRELAILSPTQQTWKMYSATVTPLLLMASVWLFSAEMLSEIDCSHSSSVGASSQMMIPDEVESIPTSSKALGRT